MYAGSIRSRQAAVSTKAGSSKRQGILALAAVALITGTIIGIRQEWTFTTHLTDQATAIHHAEAHHAEVVHLASVPTPVLTQEVERRAAAEKAQLKPEPVPEPTPSPAEAEAVKRAEEHAPAAEPQEQQQQRAEPEPEAIDQTLGPIVAHPDPHPKAEADPAPSPELAHAHAADPTAAAGAAGALAKEAWDRAAAVAKAHRTANRERSPPDGSARAQREGRIVEEEAAARERTEEVQRRVEEAARQQEKYERELKPEDVVMPQVAIGADGIPIPPKPHPRFAPVEMLSIASTPEIRAVVKKANEKADSVGANLVGRDLWDLSGLRPSVMREGSNAVPGQSARAIVVTFTDFRPDGEARSRLQADMVINWVRWMKRHRIHCLVGICQKELSIKAAWVLLEEGWCVPFLATEQHAIENPKVGRWWYVQEMLKQGYDVLSSDADVAWLRNPLPYFGKLIGLHPNVDVFTSTDANDGVYAYTPLRDISGKHQVAVVPLSDDEKKLPVPEPLIKRTIGKSLPYTLGFVSKPEMQGKDDSNRIKEAVSLLSQGAHDAGLENPQDCGAQWNTGVMFWRATPRAIRLLTFGKEVMAADTSFPEEPMKRDDQKPINAALRVASEACPWSEEEKIPPVAERVCGDDPQLHTVAMNQGCLGVLPVAQFSNGFTYAVARLHEQFGVRPFSFHATYASNKVLKLREEGAWIESPSRYNSMKVLWYEPDIPKELFPFKLDGGVNDKFLGQVTPWHQAALVQYQLQQLRAALAIAHVLKRTVILPRFACICECFYYRGLNCTIEGHRLHLPYLCPTDHVLWGGGKGLKVPFLEPGFMVRRAITDNPDTHTRVDDSADIPAWFLNSTTRVQTCDKPGCADNDQNHRSFFKPLDNWREMRTPQSIPSHEGPRLIYPAATKALVALELSNDEEIFNSLGKYHDVHVLKLADPVKTWGGFIRQEDEDHFRSLVGEALGRWCCWGKESRGVQFEYELQPGEEDWAQYVMTYEWEGVSQVLPLGGHGAEGSRTCNA